MTFLTWLVTLVLLAPSPEFRFTHDRCNYDGDRFYQLCGGLYQRPETWACIEVPL